MPTRSLQGLLQPLIRLLLTAVAPQRHSAHAPQHIAAAQVPLAVHGLHDVALGGVPHEGEASAPGAHLRMSLEVRIKGV